MSYTHILLCVALLCMSAFAYAAQFSGKVIVVIDGDTLLVLRDGHPVKVRLAEIDAPEVGHAGMGGLPPNSQKAQPYGMASQKSLAEMVKGKQVRVDIRAVDGYGRLVATIRIGEVNANREQVRRGMAWEYSRFHSNREFVTLQREAHQARRGLWADGDAVEPWKWRKLHPATFPAKSMPASAQDASTASDPANQSGQGQDCSKKYCSEMSSCEEALHYFTVCGKKTLDGNADGVPCEKLCATSGNKAGGSH